MKWMTVKEWLYQRWGWVVVAAAFTVNFVTYGLVYSYGILFDAFQEEFKSNATITGWVGSIAIALTVLLTPVFNILIERFGHRKTAITGLILTAGGAISTSFISIFPPIYVTYSLLVGGGTGLVYISACSLVLQYFPEENCVRACGIVAAGISAGMLSFAPFMFFLRTRFGWRVVLQTTGSIIFAIGLPCVITFSDPTKEVNCSDSRKRPDGSPENNTTTVDDEEIAECTGNGGISDLNSCEYHRSYGKEEGPEDMINCSDTRSRGDGIPEKSAPTPNDEEVVGFTVAELGSDLYSSGCDRSDAKKERPKHTRTKMTRRLRQAMAYPELWLICVVFLNNGIISCFYLVNMVNYMTSVGFTVENGSRVISVIGISDFVGRGLLSVVGEYLPFPRIFLQIIVSICGSLVIGCLLIVRTMGPMICIAVGRSIDNTGSYDSAIWAVIGMYVISGILCIVVPVYQRLFAKERFVMMELFRSNKKKHYRQKVEETVLLFNPIIAGKMIISERVTSV